MKQCNQSAEIFSQTKYMQRRKGKSKYVVGTNAMDQNEQGQHAGPPQRSDPLDKNRLSKDSKPDNLKHMHPEMPAPCTDPVVISGVSCRLPQSDNMQEFRDNLMNGVDMVTEDSSRWQPGNVNIDFS